jgi:hypothetical protein
MFEVAGHVIELMSSAALWVGTSLQPMLAAYVYVCDCCLCVAAFEFKSPIQQITTEPWCFKV